MQLTKPRGVLFDFGDTLMREGPVDLRAGAAAVLAIAATTNGCTADQLAQAFAALMADLNPRRRASQLEPPPHTVWRLIYEPLGIRFAASPVDVEWTFWAGATTWTIEPGAVEAVASLARAGIPSAVLSNTMFRAETIARHLAANGFEKAFRWVMTSADFVLRKPHRRLFELAARRMGEAPADLWFIGDSWEFDVAGAVGAGLVPIWYCPGVPAQEPESVVHALPNWLAFEELLERVMGTG